MPGWYDDGSEEEYQMQMKAARRAEKAKEPASPAERPAHTPLPEDLREEYAYYRKYMKSSLRVDDLIERIGRSEAACNNYEALRDVVKIMQDAMNDKAHAWNRARKWLDEHDVYHGDLQENAVLAEVCKVALTNAKALEGLPIAAFPPAKEK